jgi:site-specific recombinase
VAGEGSDRDPDRGAGLERLRAGLDALPRGGDESGWTARVEWLRALASWLAAEPGRGRVDLLVERLRADPEGAGRLRDAVQAVFESGQGLRLLADGGFPQRHSLVQDSLVRLVRGVVPSVPDSRDLGDVVESCLAGETEGAWLARLPQDALADLLEAAGLADRALWPRLRAHLTDATRIHGLRCANIGVAEDFRRALGGSLASSPFLRLDAASAALLEAAAGPAPDGARRERARAGLERCIADARAARKAVLEHLDRTGVSTGLVHRLDLLARGLDRIEGALPLLAPREGERTAAAAAALLVRLVADLRHEANPVNAFRDRSRLLARKIAESTGAAGAAYITVDRAAWWRMFGMGCGGGVVIALAALGKSAIQDLQPPPGTLSLLVFLDYAAAFLLIYAMHWTLATKQPPATAAALVTALAAEQSRHDPRPIQDLVARISRSQIAGLLGNVLFTAAGCLAIDALHRLLRGRPVLEEGDAVQVLLEHHLLASGTPFFAILTGCAVWLSSMAAGWAENAAAYGRLKESLVPRGPLAGRTRGGRATAWVVNNLAGVVGNTALALFLVLINFTGKIFGVPLDVRHVTISTAFVTLSCCSIVDFTSPDVLWAYAGVAAVGILNILTGFALSLSVAMRARGVTLRSRLALFRALTAAPLRNPLRFLYPVGRESAPADAPPAAAAPEAAATAPRVASGRPPTSAGAGSRPSP